MPFPDFTPTVPELLHRSAARFGDHTYVVADHERLSYADADARSAAVARGLLAEGIGKGSRVGVLMPNSVDDVVAVLAVLRIGAVLVPMNTFLQTRELGWTIRHADLSMLITCPRFLNNDYLERLEEALPGLADPAVTWLVLPDAPYLRTIHVWGGSNRAWDSGSEPDVIAEAARLHVTDAFLARVEECVVPADPAMIVYSSGSTADPKGVLLTQGTVVRHSFNVLIV